MSNMVEKPIAVLRNWQCVIKPPGTYLMGEVFGHPKHDDGEEIRTGMLIHFDQFNRYAETLTMRYKLEKEKEVF